MNLHAVGLDSTDLTYYPMNTAFTYTASNIETFPSTVHAASGDLGTFPPIYIHCGWALQER